MANATVDNGWGNSADSESPAVIAKARYILQNTPYCSLSTCSAEGIPWASPVFYVFDSKVHLYWSSAISSRHSQNLYTNQGRVAISIYGTDGGEGKGQGLYFSGTAGEVNHEKVEAVIKLLNERSGHQNRAAADYLPPSPRRLYRFEPEELWVTGERVPFEHFLIDTKVKLNRKSLMDLAQPI
jgi:uncharacterized protein YhbP (UPF0306 family)